jgi:hypothetical protein
MIDVCDKMRPNQNPRRYNGRQLSDAAQDHHIPDLALPTVTTLCGYGYCLDPPRFE